MLPWSRAEGGEWGVISGFLFLADYILTMWREEPKLRLLHDAGILILILMSCILGERVSYIKVFPLTQAIKRNLVLIYLGSMQINGKKAYLRSIRPILCSYWGDLSLYYKVHVSPWREINIKAGSKLLILLGYLEKGKKSKILRVLPYLRPQGILIEEISPAEEEFIIKNNTQEKQFSITNESRYNED